eukprot:m.893338 g.893338  ORF g.893338 m.893338 type:complete len:329 (+) comp23659_c2_seq2:335-1321(+)
MSENGISNGMTRCVAVTRCGAADSTLSLPSSHSACAASPMTSSADSMRCVARWFSCGADDATALRSLSDATSAFARSAIAATISSVERSCRRSVSATAPSSPPVVGAVTADPCTASMPECLRAVSLQALWGVSEVSVGASATSRSVSAAPQSGPTRPRSRTVAPSQLTESSVIHPGTASTASSSTGCAASVGSGNVAVSTEPGSNPSTSSSTCETVSGRRAGPSPAPPGNGSASVASSSPVPWGSVPVSSLASSPGSAAPVSLSLFAVSLAGWSGATNGVSVVSGASGAAAAPGAGVAGGSRSTAPVGSSATVAGVLSSEGASTGAAA